MSERSDIRIDGAYVLLDSRRAGDDVDAFTRSVAQMLRDVGGFSSASGFLEFDPEGGAVEGFTSPFLITLTSSESFDAGLAHLRAMIVSGSEPPRSGVERVLWQLRNATIVIAEREWVLALENAPAGLFREGRHPLYVMVGDQERPDSQFFDFTAGRGQRAYFWWRDSLGVSESLRDLAATARECYETDMRACLGHVVACDDQVDQFSIYQTIRGWLEDEPSWPRERCRWHLTHDKDPERLADSLKRVVGWGLPIIALLDTFWPDDSAGLRDAGIQILARTLLESTCGLGADDAVPWARVLLMTSLEYARRAETRILDEAKTEVVRTFAKDWFTDAEAAHSEFSDDARWLSDFAAAWPEMVIAPPATEPVDRWSIELQGGVGGTLRVATGGDGKPVDFPWRPSETLVPVVLACLYGVRPLLSTKTGRLGGIRLSRRPAAVDGGVVSLDAIAPAYVVLQCCASNAAMDAEEYLDWIADWPGPGVVPRFKDDGNLLRRVTGPLVKLRRKTGVVIEKRGRTCVIAGAPVVPAQIDLTLRPFAAAFVEAAFNRLRAT